jgi:hypothetical protein
VAHLLRKALGSCMPGVSLGINLLNLHIVWFFCARTGVHQAAPLALHDPTGLRLSRPKDLGGVVNTAVVAGHWLLQWWVDSVSANRSPLKLGLTPCGIARMKSPMWYG